MTKYMLQSGAQAKLMHNKAYAEEGHFDLNLQSLWSNGHGWANDLNMID